MTGLANDSEKTPLFNSVSLFLRPFSRALSRAPSHASVHSFSVAATSCSSSTLTQKRVRRLVLSNMHDKASSKAATSEESLRFYLILVLRFLFLPFPAVRLIPMFRHHGWLMPTSPTMKVVDWSTHIHGVTPQAMQAAVVRGDALTGWREARELWTHIDRNTILVGRGSKSL